MFDNVVIFHTYFDEDSCHDSRLFPRNDTMHRDTSAPKLTSWNEMTKIHKQNKI